MVVVEEEMQKGPTGKTQPTTNGRDLGMREVGVQDGTQGGPRYHPESRQPGSRAGLTGRGRMLPDLFSDMLLG